MDIEDILVENVRLSKEWQECHNWNMKIISENQYLKNLLLEKESKIRELEGEKEGLFKRIARLMKI
jgi:hypothetical protein